MPPPDYIRGMFMFLISNVHKDIHTKHGFPSVLPDFSFETLNDLSSVVQFEDWLTGFFTDYGQLLQESSGDAHSHIIRTAKDYICTHLDQTVKAKDVAAIVGLSESYFTIYFKNHAGINFRDYVLNEKINHAKELILAHKLPVSEVAYAVGYQDYRSFSRAFKNVTECSPSEYPDQKQT